MTKVIRFLITLIIVFYCNNSLHSEENSLTFSKINNSIATVNQTDYLNFLRVSILDQPEYSYSVSTVTEKDMSLRFAKRNRYPDLSLRIINDSVLKRDIEDNTSVRKRRDDSFDAAVELSQPLYSGGAINARIGMAKNDYNVSKLAREQTVSQQIVQANIIYLQAVKSDFLYAYGVKILNDAQPYLDRVKERVNAGISDPMNLAVFSIRFNDLYSKVQMLETQRGRDIAIYEYFFKKEFKNVFFPNVLVPFVINNKERVGYDVELSILGHRGKEIETKLTKSEFRPQFGFNTRYTRYDLKDDGNESDVRGGIYFSLPLFTFGRATAKISSYEARAAAAKMYIDIERKKDDGTEAEVVSAIKASHKTRSDVYDTFSDTKKQRNIIRDRLEIIDFAPEAYIDTGLKELNQLERFLTTEVNLLDGYMQYLHQNRVLNSFLMIRP